MVRLRSSYQGSTDMEGVANRACRGGRSERAPTTAIVNVVAFNGVPRCRLLRLLDVGRASVMMGKCRHVA